MSILNSQGGPLNLKRAFRVWQRNFTVYKRLYKSSFVLNFVEPLLYLLALGLGLGAYVGYIDNVTYIKFIAPGIVASSALFAATFECTYGTYVRMHFQKTFDAILATPVNIDDLTMGELLWGSTKSVIYGISIIIVISLMGLVDSTFIILSIPFLFIGGLIFASISIIAVSVVPGIDSLNYFYTLFMTPLFLFSGIFFPVEGLPYLVRVLSFLSPFYHTVNICRRFSQGAIEVVLIDILYLFIFLIIIIPVPFILMRRNMIK